MWTKMDKIGKLAIWTKIGLNWTKLYKFDLLGLKLDSKNFRNITL